MSSRTAVPNSWVGAHHWPVAYLEPGHASGEPAHMYTCSSTRTSRGTASMCARSSTCAGGTPAYAHPAHLAVQLRAHARVCRPAVCMSGAVHTCVRSSPPLARPGSPLPPPAEPPSYKGWGQPVYRSSIFVGLFLRKVLTG